MIHTINTIGLKIIKKILIKKGYFGIDEFAQLSFSQMGEDQILKHLFPGNKKGFYVDVGAYHPKLYSNTYIFYLKGWTGINIDATPGSMKSFKGLRPKDINLEIPVGNQNQPLTYYMFNEPALNGFSYEFVKERQKSKQIKLVRKLQLITSPLSEILDTYLPKGKKIDFLSIDVEGMDYNVLLSNSWNKYKPTIIVIEDIDFSFSHANSSLIYRFLIKKDYTLIAKTNVTLFFAKKEGYV